MARAFNEQRLCYKNDESMSDVMLVDTLIGIIQRKFDLSVTAKIDFSEKHPLLTISFTISSALIPIANAVKVMEILKQYSVKIQTAESNPNTLCNFTSRNITIKVDKIADIIKTLHLAEEVKPTLTARC